MSGSSFNKPYWRGSSLASAIREGKASTDRTCQSSDMPFEFMVGTRLITRASAKSNFAKTVYKFGYSPFLFWIFPIIILDIPHYYDTIHSSEIWFNNGVKCLDVKTATRVASAWEFQ